MNSTTPTAAQIEQAHSIAMLCFGIASSKTPLSIESAETVALQVVMESHAFAALAQPAIAAPEFQTGFLHTVSELMRNIDSYASDYQKYTQVKGCQIIQSDYVYNGYVSFEYVHLKIGRDVFLTASKAIAHAEAQRQARIASIRRTLAKLEALTYAGTK